MQGIQRRIRFHSFEHSWCFLLRMWGSPTSKLSQTFMNASRREGDFSLKSRVNLATFR